MRSEVQENVESSRIYTFIGYLKEIILIMLGSFISMFVGIIGTTYFLDIPLF